MKKKTFFSFISFMLIANTYLPLVFVNLPEYIGSYYIWTGLWLASLLILKPQVLLNKIMLIVFFYGIFMLLIMLNYLWIDVRDWDKELITREYFIILVGVSVIVYFRIEKDYENLAKLVKWTIIFMGITAILSIATSIINPMYARDLTGISSIHSTKERIEVLSYQRYGGGSYGFASSVISLFPLLIYYYKNNQYSFWSKKFLMFYIVLIFIALIRIQIFANILISSVIIALSALGRKRILTSFIVIAILTVIVIFIPIKFYVNVLTSLATLFQKSSELNFKFNDMATFLSTQSTEGGGIGLRAARYPVMWQSFVSNPMFGGEYSNGHLYWMNKLAVFGLLGTVPFLLIIYQHIKINLKYFNEEFSFYFLLSIFSIIALGGMKALTGRELWYVFFIIIPGFYYLPLLIKKTKN